MGTAYCGTGCQPAFGKCTSTGTTVVAQAGSSGSSRCGPKYKKRRCSAGDCCSKYGCVPASVTVEFLDAQTSSYNLKLGETVTVQLDASWK